MPDNGPSVANQGAENADLPLIPDTLVQVANMSEMDKELVANIMLSRSELFSKFLDPRRNINEECGYPNTIGSAQEFYKALYDREPIPARVVSILSDESWKNQPTVYEDEDSDTVTPFEEAWDTLSQGIRGKSWYQDEEGSPIWDYLRRADELSGIGQYGVILLGIDDGKELAEPADGIDDFGDPTGKTYNATKPVKLMYIRAFDESQAQITALEQDEENPRYGQPVKYLLSFVSPSGFVSGVVESAATQEVHWSRVIHIADNLKSSEVFGVPRMQPVYNRLLDLRKLYSGSAEMYWRGAFPGLSIETHPQLGGNVKVDEKSIREKMSSYMNGLSRYFMVMGASTKSLAPQVVDPTPQINIHLEAVCIYLNIPMRIFKGSERGELASSQDERQWKGRLLFRQTTHITPRIIVPFIDRCICLGILPEPEGYSCEWPDVEALTEDEIASIGLKRTQAMVAYMSSGAEALMQPLDFFTRILGFDEDEAQSIVDAAIQGQQDPLTYDTPEEIAQQQADQARMMVDSVPEQFPPKNGNGNGAGKIPSSSRFSNNQRVVVNKRSSKYRKNRILNAKRKLVVNRYIGRAKFLRNVFCATGEGGGIDPSCSPGGSSGAASGGNGSTAYKGSLRKLTIDKADYLLQQKGYKIIKGLGTDLDKHITSYLIKHPDGKTSKMDTDEIKGIIKDKSPRSVEGHALGEHFAGTDFVKNSPITGMERDLKRIVVGNTIDKYTDHKTGKLLPERQKLHDSIIKEIMGDAKPVNKPVGYLLGGGSGSGKSTLVNSGLAKIPTKNVAIVNSDLVKTKIPDYNQLIKQGKQMVAAPIVHEESGDVAWKALNKAAKAHLNIVVDSTGDGGYASLKEKVDAMRAGGHRVVANYVTIPTELALARADARFKSTTGPDAGRLVEPQFLKAIHAQVSAIFPQAVKNGLFDEATLWDNQGKTPVKVMHYDGKSTVVYKKDLWEGFLRKNPDYKGPTANYDPNEARDNQGQWTDSGGGSAGDLSHVERTSMGRELKSLYKRIAEKDGGFTYSPMSGKEPKDGYAVSPYPKLSFAKSAKDVKPADLISYINNNAKTLSQPDHYIGGWHDPASGKVYLDVSVVKHNSSEAHDLCKKHDQIAYFDLKNFTSVTVDQKATSGGAALK